MAAKHHHHHPPRYPSFVVPCLLALVFLSLPLVLLHKVANFAAQLKTVAGHNLHPTPWHVFRPNSFHHEIRHSRALKILQCSYLTCRSGSYPTRSPALSGPAPKCPDFFKFVHWDLEPWAQSRISIDVVRRAKSHAAFRVVISGGKVFVDLYYACVQSRLMFTVWGILQLLQRYPGMVPDVDMMFDCMDKPSINQTKHAAFPLPLFRYSTTEDHFDIPFPDWSFWGWPEVDIKPWDEQFREIKKGSLSKTWEKKIPRAYWRGDLNVSSRIRKDLLLCNHSRIWGAQIVAQNCSEEVKYGFEYANLSSQCNHRYKLYAEGHGGTVSLKYILACGSLALLISPQYDDFFTRALAAKENYWPISSSELCPSIRFAVDWGNMYPAKAEAMGKRGQRLMESMNMATVYDYMFHLITEYSKLLDFKPVPPPSAREVCPESLLCLADPEQQEFLEMSAAMASRRPPCSLEPAKDDFIRRWFEKRMKVIEELNEMEMHRRVRQQA